MFCIIKASKFRNKTHHCKLSAWRLWVLSSNPKIHQKKTWQNILKYFCPVEHFLGTRNQHGIKCQRIPRQTRFILNNPWSPLFDDLVKSRKNGDFKIWFQVVWGLFSSCLPLSNSLEMFHEDVGMKSATSEEFTPGRGEEKNHEMLLINGFYIIRNQIIWFIH